MDNLNTRSEGASVNFLLFFLAIFMSLLNNNLSTILHYVLYFKNKFTKSANYFELKTQLEIMQKECSQIDMTDEFAKYARLQRKIIKIQDELKRKVFIQKGENIRNKLMLQVILGIMSIATVSTFHAYPVVHVPPEWFYPISSLLCWPGVEPGSISFLVWLAVSNSVVKTVL